MYLQSALVSVVSLICFYYWKVQPVFCLLATSLLLISLYWKHKEKNKAIVRWPIVSVFPSIFQNMHRFHDWTVDVVNLWGSTIYILKTNFPNFPKGDDFKETLDIFGDSLIMDSPLWNFRRKATRKLLMSSLSRNVIADASNKAVQDSLIPFLHHAVRNSLIIDLQDVFSRYTFDTSFSVIFGRSADYISTRLLPNELAQGLDDAMEDLFYRNVLPNACWKLCRRLMIGSERKMDKAWKAIDRSLAMYIKEKREDIAETSSLWEVDISKFIQNENVELSDNRLVRDCGMAFFTGGNDTTGSALTWFFWLVAENLNVEAKILEELKRTVFSKKKDFTHKEDRLKRPLVFDTDDLKDADLAGKKDVLPDGTIVDPGMMIFVWGKYCLELKPERWINENGKLNHETMSKFWVIGPSVVYATIQILKRKMLKLK
ncbi:hypothetical protein MKX01_008060 [Papaver californicum]|nr:hypothetical protein MKX01_008060 [Papaver californicum]